jgi:hypothetical protein
VLAATIGLLFLYAALFEMHLAATDPSGHAGARCTREQGTAYYPCLETEYLKSPVDMAKTSLIPSLFLLGLAAFGGAIAVRGAQRERGPSETDPHTGIQTAGVASLAVVGAILWIASTLVATTSLSVPDLDKFVPSGPDRPFSIRLPSGWGIGRVHGTASEYLIIDPDVDESLGLLFLKDVRSFPPRHNPFRTGTSPLNDRWGYEGLSQGVTDVDGQEAWHLHLMDAALAPRLAVADTMGSPLETTHEPSLDVLLLTFRSDPGVSVKIVCTWSADRLPRLAVRRHRQVDPPLGCHGHPVARWSALLL